MVVGRCARHLAAALRLKPDGVCGGRALRSCRWEYSLVPPVNCGTIPASTWPRLPGCGRTWRDRRRISPKAPRNDARMPAISNARRATSPRSAATRRSYWPDSLDYCAFRGLRRIFLEAGSRGGPLRWAPRRGSRGSPPAGSCVACTTSAPAGPRARVTPSAPDGLLPADRFSRETLARSRPTPNCAALAGASFLVSRNTRGVCGAAIFSIRAAAAPYFRQDAPCSSLAAAARAFRAGIWSILVCAVVELV